MATLTDRLLVLQADGRTSRNNPADTLSVGSAILFTGTFTVGAPAAERAVALYPTTFSVAATGLIQVNSSAAAIQIGNGANAQPIDVGTGAAQRTITVGNATGNTSVVLNAGTGGVLVGTNATDHPVTLGSTVGSSPVTIQAGTGGLAFEMADNVANAARFRQGATDYLACDTLDGGERVVFGVFTDVARGGGITLTSAEAIAAGDLVAVLLADPTGRACKADANDANRQNVVGVALTTVGAADLSVRVNSLSGTVVTPTFAAAPAAADNGKVVYLSTTAGQTALTAPIVPGEAVIQVGILVGGDGALVNPRVIFQPTFLRIV